ncbi:MAG: dimethyl sulfone monooxygenase SfnG [Ktedonobacteraceae bacterium]
MDIQFAYWVPNVSGGLVTSNIVQHTDWSFDYNHRLALTAEAAGFDYALAQARFFASYGADKQLEAVTTAISLAAVTKRLNLIAAVHPGLWHPAVIANVIASANYISNGRVSLNVVSGWFKDEYTGFGAEWLEHDERYVRSEEFIRILKGMWTQERFSFNGKYYQIQDVPMEPKPISKPHPTIFQGGNSPAAREMAARVADVLFMNGGSVEHIAHLVQDVKRRAERYGRANDIRFAMNAFVISRDTEEEALKTLRNIVAKANVEAVKGFGEAVKEAGQSAPEGEGMWSNSGFEDLVQYNDGFKPKLIGTPEQIASRIQAYEAVGVDILLTGFLHFIEEVENFGWSIRPLVQALPSLRSEHEFSLAHSGSGIVGNREGR